MTRSPPPPAPRPAVHRLRRRHFVPIEDVALGHHNVDSLRIGSHDSPPFAHVMTSEDRSSLRDERPKEAGDTGGHERGHEHPH